MNEPPKKNTRVLIAAVGCLALIGMCCCAGGGAYLLGTESVSGPATAHANAFLTHLRSQNYAAAHAATVYRGSPPLTTAAQFRTCIMDTPLGDIQSFSCHDADVHVADQDADVQCMVQSASQGAQPVTLHVNPPTDAPYIGFVWFSAAGRFSGPWLQDACAGWSGIAFRGEPPAERVRPGGVPRY